MNFFLRIEKLRQQRVNLVSKMLTASINLQGKLLSAAQRSRYLTRWWLAPAEVTEMHL